MSMITMLDEVKGILTERETFLSVLEASNRYNVGEATIWRWFNAHRLTPHKFPFDQKTYVNELELRVLLAALGRLDNGSGANLS